MLSAFIAEDITYNGNVGRFIQIKPKAIRQLKSKETERAVPLHQILERFLDASLPKQRRLIPYLTVNAVVKR